MTATQRYYELKDLSECKWREAQDLIQREEDVLNRRRSANHGEISQEDQAEWMRKLADAYALQQEAIKIEAEATLARVEMIREQYRIENDWDNNDYHELMQEQSELRRG